MSEGKLVQAWNISDVVGDLEEFEQEKITRAIKVFQYVGEDFVNKARNIRTYKDRTGNLRSSIGYLIALDGKKVSESFGEKVPKFSGEGKAEGGSEAKKLIQGDSGVVIVGVAGMEYGRAVEARGLDVITGSAILTRTLLKTLVKEI